jgi:pimeloyl-ACP methyl ester carboxylesterase
MTRSIGLLLFYMAFTLSAQGQIKQGHLVTEKFASEILKENLIGLDANRIIHIYLPPGYEASRKSYPVVYYFHSIFTKGNQVFDDGVGSLLDRAFTNGITNEFIFVAADYSSPTIGSLYENSQVSGRWLDFTVNELVPFVDSKYRTLKTRDSRAVVGHFMGGRGALKLVMTHAEKFGVAYALHPVATGIGYTPWSLLSLDWKKVYTAKTFDEVGNAKIFVAVGQAFSPNLNRPPFYADFIYEPDTNGEPQANATNIIKSKAGFHLEETLNESAMNLRTLRGLAFDWGRFDSNQDHVHANQVFSRKLYDLGVAHDAEEYNGNPWSKIWTNDGRFYTRVLPFLAQHLVFDEKK